MRVRAFVSGPKARGGAARLRGIDRRDRLQHADRTRHELHLQTMPNARAVAESAAAAACRNGLRSADSVARLSQDVVEVHERRVAQHRLAQARF
jgi:hypothetical protein